MVGLDLSRRLGLHTSSLMPKGKSVEPAMYLLLLLATYLLFWATYLLLNISEWAIECQYLNL